MRLFAAISAPDDLRHRLIALQAGLPEGRLTLWRNLHLTLAFFDEVDGAQAEDLHAGLGAIRAEAFDIWADGVGAFGGVRPRLLYAGVRASAELNALHDRVAQAAREAGISISRERYTPHFTLKRLRSGEMPPARAARWLEGNGAFLAGPIRVSGFSLFRSTLGHAAPIYEEMADYRLTAPATATRP